MNNQLKTSIIDTLSYFDVFNYPLTLEQIELFLHFSDADKKAIAKNIKEIGIIDEKYGYYFFSGRKGIAIKRKMQEEENRRKTLLAAKYIDILSKVPGVRLIAITGSLSMGNASVDDDIDLFIITRKNMLWATRFMVILTAKIFGMKREYKNKRHKDKLCLNMFLDEREMEFTDKSLYVAHEIAQMKVYYDEHKVFSHFAKKNSWIKDFFPNITVNIKRMKKKKRWTDLFIFSEKPLRVVNFVAFFGQYLYMSSKITREKVSLRKAFFHPSDSTRFILDQHIKRKRYYLARYSYSNIVREFEAKKSDLKKDRMQN